MPAHTGRPGSDREVPATAARAAPAVKTSLSHPLRIADIPVAPGAGSVGITFCPGKKDAASLSGPWDRDLDLDLDAIAAWGAAAVVTLVETWELEHLSVPELGAQVERRGMRWLHLPIVDVSTPGAHFEARWRDLAPDLHRHLRGGGKVLVHCRGGIGRAGTIGARLLVELGWTPDEAIGTIRRVRDPNAIETFEQEAYVRRCRPVMATGSGRGPV